MKSLRLKQESYREPGESSGYASVLVDTGVFHLDYLFDYKVPSSLADLVHVGARVQVSFHGVRCEGLVYALKNSPDKAGLVLLIEKVLGTVPVATSETIELVSRISQRWAAHPYDVWRSALPPRSISAEKNRFDVPPSEFSGDQFKPCRKKRCYHFLPPHRAVSTSIASIAAGYLSHGNVLLVLPDEKDVENFIRSSEISNIVNISSSLSKVERYSAFLSLKDLRSNIIVGNRSAILAPIPHLAAIVVHRELSESHYEIRSPGWNVRDVALLRNELSGTPLVFTGFSPSSEMARLISSGYVEFVSEKRRESVKSFPAHEGELLPSRLVQSVRQDIKSGNVLFLVPRKGYASGIICTKCRNVAHHSCGGVLTSSSLKGPFTCSQCHTDVGVIACSWCKNQSFSVTGRGSARFVEEIGKAFPGALIKESTGEKLIGVLDNQRALVVSTSGAQPESLGGYAGAYVLQAERFLAGIDMRSLERSEDAFFYTMSLTREGGTIAFTLESSHPVIASITTWNPKLLLLRALRERQEASLPPYVRTIEIEAPLSEISMIESGLIKARSDGRFPVDARIALMGTKLRIYLSIKSADSGTAFMHELQRKRSSQGKKLLSLRVDPYQLN